MTLKEDLLQLSKELRTRALKTFPRRKINTAYVNQYWGADLVDMSNVKSKNHNITFLLNVVDLYSRYAWSIPLKSKTGKEVYEAFESIGAWPEHLWVDEGKEFYNTYVQAWCSAHKIEMYSTHSGLKSVFVESFNKTMKEAFYRHFAENQNTKFSTFLPVFIDIYNNRIHSATKETPYNVYNKIKPSLEIDESKAVTKTKFKIGDYVRLSKIKRTFEKGYTDRWTYEAFQISFVDKRYQPVMYNVIDMLGEPIEGAFYTQELIATKIPNFKLIEKALQRKKVDGKDMVLVEYKGYPDKFNKWLSKSEYDNFMREKKNL